MHRNNFMDISELRSMVAQHLSGDDLRACALVCKAWHETFTSCLWSKFIVSHDLCVDYNRWGGTNGQRDAIIKHSHRIRDLLMGHIGEREESRGPLEFFVSNCTSLVAFSDLVDFSNWAPNGAFAEVSNSDLVQKLIDQNPSLQRLSINTISRLQLTPLSALSNLRVLEIREKLSVHDVLAILATFPSLNDLTLYVSFSPHSCLSPPTSDLDHIQLPSLSPLSSSLRCLTLSNASDVFDLTYLLEQCPNLRHLSFKSMRSGHHRAIGVLRPGLLLHLKSVSLDYNKGERDNSMILEALGSHSVRTFSIGNPTRNTFLSLPNYHAHHIEHLSMAIHAYKGRSLMVILTQCTSLRTLNVDLVKYDSGLIDLRHLIGEPWKCTMLEELVLPITLDRRHQETSLEDIAADEKEGLAKTSEMTKWQKAEAVFMKRLGSLTRLRRFVQKRPIWYKAKPSPDISWQLTGGLGHLQHLDRLETLKLDFHEYVQGIPEFQWMKQHFKSMSTLVMYDMRDSNKREWMNKHWPELCVIERVNIARCYST